MKKFLKWVGIVIGALIAIPLLIAVFSLVFEGSGVSTEPTKELTAAQKDSVLKVEAINEIAKTKERIKYLKDYTWDANSLLAQYENNELKANEMFKNKTVLVKGVIKDIGEDIVGQPYLLIGDYNYSSIQCVFPKNKASILAQGKKGQTVLVQGKCKSKLMNVLFEDCMFPETEKDLLKKIKDLQIKK